MSDRRDAFKWRSTPHSLPADCAFHGCGRSAEFVRVCSLRPENSSPVTAVRVGYCLDHLHMAAALFDRRGAA